MIEYINAVAAGLIAVWAGGCEHHCEHLFALCALGSCRKVGESRLTTGFCGCEHQCEQVCAPCLHWCSHLDDEL